RGIDLPGDLKITTRSTADCGRAATADREQVACKLKIRNRELLAGELHRALSGRNDNRRLISGQELGRGDRDAGRGDVVDENLNRAVGLERAGSLQRERSARANVAHEPP